MVLVTGVKTRKNSIGEDFTTLEIQGGLEMVKSKETGKYYATARKTTISCTFDERTARSFIGTKMPGSIQKVECDPYDYTNSDGEIVELNFTYSYNPDPSSIEEAVMGESLMTA